jgi:hypothetical protein
MNVVLSQQPPLHPPAPPIPHVDVHVCVVRSQAWWAGQSAAVAHPQRPSTHPWPAGFEVHFVHAACEPHVAPVLPLTQPPSPPQQYPGPHVELALHVPTHRPAEHVGVSPPHWAQAPPRLPQ